MQLPLSLLCFMAHIYKVPSLYVDANKGYGSRNFKEITLNFSSLFDEDKIFNNSSIELN